MFAYWDPKSFFCFSTLIVGYLCQVHWPSSHQSSGCYSLKNTRFPEYVFNTDAGVCSLDPCQTGSPGLGSSGCWPCCRPNAAANGMFELGLDTNWLVLSDKIGFNPQNGIIQTSNQQVYNSFAPDESLSIQLEDLYAHVFFFFSLLDDPSKRTGTRRTPRCWPWACTTARCWSTTCGRGPRSPSIRAPSEPTNTRIPFGRPVLEKNIWRSCLFGANKKN